MKCPRLKDEAYPRLWPGLPAYLSKNIHIRKTNHSTSDERLKVISEREKEAQLEMEKRDSFTSLEDLDVKIDSLLPLGISKLIMKIVVIILKVVSGGIASFVEETITMQ